MHIIAFPAFAAGFSPFLADEAPLSKYAQFMRSAQLPRSCRGINLGILQDHVRHNRRIKSEQGKVARELRRHAPHRACLALSLIHISQGIVR